MNLSPRACNCVTLVALETQFCVANGPSMLPGLTVKESYLFNWCILIELHGCIIFTASFSGAS